MLYTAAIVLFYLLKWIYKDMTPEEKLKELNFQAMAKGKLTPEEYKKLRDKKREMVKKQHEQALIEGKVIHKSGNSNDHNSSNH